MAATPVSSYLCNCFIIAATTVLPYCYNSFIMADTSFIIAATTVYQTDTTVSIYLYNCFIIAATTVLSWQLQLSTRLIQLIIISLQLFHHSRYTCSTTLLQLFHHSSYNSFILSATTVYQTDTTVHHISTTVSS